MFRGLDDASRSRPLISPPLDRERVRRQGPRPRRASRYESIGDNPTTLQSDHLVCRLPTTRRHHSQVDLGIVGTFLNASPTASPAPRGRVARGGRHSAVSCRVSSAAGTCGGPEGPRPSGSEPGPEQERGAHPRGPGHGNGPIQGAGRDVVPPWSRTSKPSDLGDDRHRVYRTSAVQRKRRMSIHEGRDRGKRILGCG
jgi:hypothetical protein